MATVHTRILPKGSIDEARLTYVVMASLEGDRWLFVRHRDRSTWEMPAGHIEPGETANQAAVRELYEETGTVRSTLAHLCDYQVVAGNLTEYGRLYTAEIHEREENLEHEIGEIRLGPELPDKLTYPEVQTLLFEEAEQQLLS